jgi:anti-sigma factor RsiW
MNEETRNRIAAWFDGEIEGSAADRIEALLADDAEARAYVAELQQTREVLAGAHKERRFPVPEWEAFSARLDEPAGASAGGILSFPKALGAVAAVMVLGIAVWIPFRQASISQSTAGADLRVDSVEMVETDLEGVTPIVFLDQPSGWTVVWVLEDAETSGI